MKATARLAERRAVRQGPSSAGSIAADAGRTRGTAACFPTFRDRRLEGFDAAAVVEVIERPDPPRLAAFERVLFDFARPGMIVLTTPNRDYNVRWQTLLAGKFRQHDHRFEWTRAEFQQWAAHTSERFGYTVTFVPIGAVDAEVGSPMQMGVFTRSESEVPHGWFTR